MKLYHTPGAVSLAAHIALHEAGASFELVNLDFNTAEQRGQTYLQINPKGRVPALATDRGIITETPAILLFIAQTFPQAGLAPLEDPFALAKLQEFTSYLASTLHVAHAHKGRGERWADDPAAIAEMTRKAPQATGDAFKLIEDEYLKGPFVMGKAYTIADPYLFTVARWIEGDKIDPKTLPRIVQHRDMMRQRPAVQRTLRETKLDGFGEFQK